MFYEKIFTDNNNIIKDNDKIKIYNRKIGTYYFNSSDIINLQCKKIKISEMPDMTCFIYNDNTYRIEGQEDFICYNIQSKSTNDLINVNSKAFYLGNLQ
jgi:hypothetical protein